MKNKIIKLLLIFIAIAIPVLMWLFGLGTISKIVYPSDDITTYHYSDKDVGGNSEIISFTDDSLLTMKFILRQGYSFPYCGIGFTLKNIAPELRDFRKYDKINITIRTLEEMDLRINLKTFVNDFTTQGNPMSYLFFEKPFKSSSSFETISLQLSKFVVPVWWFEANQNFAFPNKKHAGDVHYIQVINSSFSGEEKNGGIEIASVELRGFDPLWYIVYLVCITVLVLLATLLGAYQNLKKKINCEKMVSANEAKIFSYISSNYSNPDLTLEIVAKDTGIAKNTISKLINNSLKRTFKVYLNEIRVREAARLLAEKDMSVSEVCYSVGYNNLIHFNRVFKLTYNSSPKDYKKQNLR